MNNSIPKGYKKTEIGVIPEDWEVKKLGEIAEIKRGASPRPIEKFVTKKGINWIKISDTKENDKYIYKTSVKITSNGAAKSVYIYPGDLILSNSMSYGRAYISKIKGCIHDGWLLLRPSQGVDREYLYYLLHIDTTKIKFNLLAAGSGVNNLKIDSVKNLEVCYPTDINEQRAIAQVLSDMDNLIDSVGKLIEKKKLIKKGAMQELLTGRKRLPGFKGEWVKKKLGEITEIKKGDLITEKEAKYGNIPVIGGGIQPTYYHSIPNRRANTITISASGANAGYVNFHSYPIFASDCSTIEENHGRYDIKFLYYFLKLKQREITKLQVGGAQPHVYPEQLKNLEIFYPTDINEQRAIAQVLLDMDAEIEALEKKKQKYEQIKKGAMQLLLTGRVRLKNYNTNEVLK